MNINTQEIAIKKELKMHIDVMKDSMRERAMDFSHGLRSTIEEAMATFDISSIIAQTDRYVKKAKYSGEPAYIILMDSNSMAHIHTLHPDLCQTKLRGKADLFAITQSKETVNEYVRGDTEYMESIVPINFASSHWGVLRVGYSLKRLDSMIKDSYKEIKHRKSEMVFHSIIVAIVFIIISSIIVLILSGTLTNPLINLTKTAEEIAKGDFSASDGISVRSRDEVGILAHTFIDMTHKLRTSHEQLEQYSKTLQFRIDELVNAQLSIRKLSQKVLTAHEEERKRLSMEIHDGIGQTLSALKLNLMIIERDINDGRTVQPTLISNVVKEISTGIDELRSIILELRPTYYLSNLDMGEIFIFYAKKFEHRFAIKVTVTVIKSMEISAVIKDNLFRVFQEALHNIYKHAGANNIEVQLDCDNNMLILSISDNGVGFDTSKNQDSHKEGLGILTMRERTELLDGTFTMESSPDSGTTILIKVPVQ
ncbi:MAG: HAMP domain-containing protein [Nitrospirae bacterium]|nr:HAMP domain-containing protein [Nitrospirota bacterium]